MPQMTSKINMLNWWTDKNFQNILCLKLTDLSLKYSSQTSLKDYQELPCKIIKRQRNWNYYLRF